MKFEELLVLFTALSTGIVLLAWFWRKISPNCGDCKFVAWFRSLLPVLFLVLGIRTFLLEPFRIPSGSMKPSLLPGDFILVNKFQYGLRLPISGQVLFSLGAPARGDVIVFRQKDKDLIKRVVAIAGDRVMYKDNTLYINGTAIEHKMLELVNEQGTLFLKQEEQLGLHQYRTYVMQGTNPINYPYNDLLVPENSYFVLGDNRDASEDSRFWGLVHDKQIIGRAFFVWLSIDWSEFFSIRWQHMMQYIP